MEVDWRERPPILNIRQYDLKNDLAGLEEEGEYRVLTDTGSYREKDYKNEAELVRLAEAHARQIFGENTLYFPLKKKISTKLQSRVTDGLLLDFATKTNPVIHVVEYELSSHDLRRIVVPQLRGFAKAFDLEETIRDVRDAIDKEITSNPETVKEFMRLAGEHTEIYRTLNNALHADMDILLVYDRIPENFDKILDEEDFDVELLLMEFRTFENEGKLIHLVNPLSSLETGKADGGESRLRRTGESAIQEILEVVAKMRLGKDYSEACRLVANQRSIKQQSVRDKTTRKLGISKDQFVTSYSQGTLMSLLTKKYPRAKEMIESYFGRLNP